MDVAERYRGCLLGLAIGDALGTTLEFKQPGTFQPITDMIGGGPFNLAPGQWTDDTSMALCLAESLLEKHGFDAIDQLERYVRWWKEGYLSSTGECFDIGNATSEALVRFIKTRKPFCGSTDPTKAGNGSIMRLAPIPMFFAEEPARAIEMAADSSRTTHGAPEAVDACRYLAALIVGSLRGENKQALLSDHYCPVEGYWDTHPLAPKIDEIASGSFRRKEPPAIQGTGYAVGSLEAALWAFYKSGNYRDGCLRAANLGDDADTTAAVYGQLAGAFCGESGIPTSWLEKLAMRNAIVSFADGLALASRQVGKPAPNQKQGVRSFDSEVRKAVDEDTAPVPFERSYWVVPGKFLAGAYPGDPDPERAEEKLRGLLAAGIRCILDLTAEGDRNRYGRVLVPYRDLMGKAAAAEKCKVDYHSKTITDVDIPSREEMVEMLDIIDGAIGSDRPVYVHCLGGIGRTGTVVGCWLARHGAAKGQAVIELIRKLRRNEGQAHIDSPETARQRRFVCEWKEGE
jgi:ADP-ribosylglycohydrolase